MNQRIKKYIFTGIASVICMAVILTIMYSAGMFRSIATSGDETVDVDAAAAAQNEDSNEDTTKWNHDKVKTEMQNDTTLAEDGYPYYIGVNRAANCVTIYVADSKGYYTVPYKAMTCSTGTDTPVGVFSISDKYVWRLLVGNVYGQYASRICDDILFHSVPYYTQDKSDLETEEYNKLGTKASLGCIRLTVADCKWIYDNCPSGTIVEIYDDEANPGPLGKPTVDEIPLDTTWDPTDPDKCNPWTFRVKSLTVPESGNIERGSSFDPLDGVIAMNSNNLGILASVEVEGTVDTSKLGTYKLTYTISDYYGGLITKTRTVKVIDTIVPKLYGIPDIRYWSDPATLTDEVLMSGVYALDGETSMNSSSIKISHGAFAYGDNVVTYTVSDAAGNTSTKEGHVYIDGTAPSVTISSTTTVPHGTSLTWEYLRTRIVSMSDDFSGVDESSIMITSTQTSSNSYVVTYAVADYCGNTTTVSETVYIDSAPVVSQPVETEPSTEEPASTEPETQEPEVPSEGEEQTTVAP